MPSLFDEWPQLLVRHELQLLAVASPDHGHDDRGLRFLVRYPPGRDLPRQNSIRIYVGLGRVLRGVDGQCLWCNIMDSAHERLIRKHCAGGGGHPRETEVRKLSGIPLVEQNVVGLQIPVNHVHRMEIVEPLDRVQQEGANLHGGILGVDALESGLDAQLHDERWRMFPEVDDTHDVFVLELLQHLELLPELGHVHSTSAASKHFHCDWLAVQLALPHLTVGADADGPNLLELGPLSRGMENTSDRRRPHGEADDHNRPEALSGWKLFFTNFDLCGWDAEYGQPLVQGGLSRRQRQNSGQLNDLLPE
mmetsp:Transcript_115086/g.308620  ORF Transcript_115086/g.308620 Transcript_115086/m.308620 type:complete len:307 (-) Transcript_115086:487-1407(-)